jgi:hypothetical protein
MVLDHSFSSPIPKRNPSWKEEGKICHGTPLFSGLCWNTPSKCVFAQYHYNFVVRLHNTPDTKNGSIYLFYRGITRLRRIKPVFLLIQKNRKPNQAWFSSVCLATKGTKPHIDQRQDLTRLQNHRPPSRRPPSFFFSLLGQRQFSPCISPVVSAPLATGRTDASAAPPRTGSGPSPAPSRWTMICRQPWTGAASVYVN